MLGPFLWTVIGLVWIFGWTAIWLIRKRSREQQLLRVREMLHRERLAAIEAGTPLPEIPDLGEPAEWLTEEADRVRALWLRRSALIIGLVSVATGAGMCAAFYWAPDRGFYEMWTIGLIPVLAGAGFLLYFLVAPVIDRASAGNPDSG
jgi:hypothetical protein